MTHGSTLPAPLAAPWWISAWSNRAVAIGAVAILLVRSLTPAVSAISIVFQVTLIVIRNLPVAHRAAAPPRYAHAPACAAAQRMFAHIAADPLLNRTLAGRKPVSALRVGAVLSCQEPALPDRRREEIGRPISLIDDVLPSPQLSSTVPGHGTHANSGLFHPDVFRRVGGVSDCIEEDREFPNRRRLTEEVDWLSDDLLLIQIEIARAISGDIEAPVAQAVRQTAEGAGNPQFLPMDLAKASGETMPVTNSWNVALICRRHIPPARILATRRRERSADDCGARARVASNPVRRHPEPAGPAFGGPARLAAPSEGGPAGIRDGRMGDIPDVA